MVTAAILIMPCEDCQGSGNWFDMPVTKRQLPYGEIAPSNCASCQGWGLVPTEAGRPFFDMIVALRASPKWR